MSADADTLMRQAPMTVDLYLRKAVESIDEVFGAGYAKANPAVVAAFMQACSWDFATTMGSNSVDRLADAINAGLANLG